MASRFEFTATPLAGLTVVDSKAVGDSRGFFARLFCVEEFRRVGLTKPIAQINQSLTREKGAVRGLHFQYPPHAEVKIVSCLRGEVFDVAVDLRRNSATFLQWHGVVLSGENRRSLYIPEGFAHGFQTLVGDCELLYFHTAPYVPQAEGALHVQDPQINICWPMPIAGISQRDRTHAFIGQDFEGMHP